MNRTVSQEIPSQARANSAFVSLLWCLIGYCIVSTLTLPLIGQVWLGDLPLLAIVQLPKIQVAGWLRTEVVMEAIKLIGVSKGAFSPDYIMARPYALAIAYLIPMLVVAGVSWPRFRSYHPKGLLVVIGFFMTAVIDYMFTLLFAAGRVLTIY